MVYTDCIVMFFCLFDGHVQEEGTQSETYDACTKTKRVEIVNTGYDELAEAN